MLKITADVLDAKDVDRKFTDSEKEVVAYALTTFFNGKGFMVDNLRIQEVKNGLAPVGK